MNNWWKRVMKTNHKVGIGGENVAVPPLVDISDVFTAWKNSPGHHRDIMNCQLRTIGVGFNVNGDYWVQDLS